MTQSLTLTNQTKLNYTKPDSTKPNQTSTKPNQTNPKRTFSQIILIIDIIQKISMFFLPLSQFKDSKMHASAAQLLYTLQTCTFSCSCSD